MKSILTEQLLRMQKLAGLLTESEYKEKLDEISDEEEEKLLEPVKEFIGKSYTIYTRNNLYGVNIDDIIKDGSPLQLNKNTSKICDGCLFIEDSNFAFSTSSPTFIYNKAKDNFILEKNLNEFFGIDKATAELLVQFAKKINPNSTLTPQNIKVEDNNKPIPVFGIHFDNKKYGDLNLDMQ